MFKAYCFQEGDVYFTEDEIPEGSLLICSGRKPDVKKAIYENCIEGTFDNGKQLMVECVNTAYKFTYGNNKDDAEFLIDVFINWIIEVKNKYKDRPIIFSQ